MEVVFYIVIALIGLAAYYFAKESADLGCSSCFFWMIIAGTLLGGCLVAGLQVLFKTILNIFYW